MTATGGAPSESLDSPASPRRPPRIGAGTTQRFVLLAALFVAGALSMLSDLVSLLTDPLNNMAGCELAAGFDPVHNSPANVLAQDTPAFHVCIDQHVGRWTLLWLPLLATAAVLMLTILLALLIPRWKGRRARVRPLEHTEVTDWLATLAATSGLPRTPAFVVDRTALFSANAVVFGRPGRYTVRLDMGLVKLFHQDRSAFEATMLHEFAHIRNRDVDITYLTVALWRVFLIAVLIPFAAVNGWKLAVPASEDNPFDGSGAVLARNLALAAFMVVLMYLTTADVLRTREIHADLDAVAQGADVIYWTRHRRPGPGRQSPVRAAGRAVSAILRTHPDWDMRVAALADASAPIAVRALPMFLTGASVEVLGYLITFTPGLNNYLPGWLADLGMWPAAALATAVGGAAVWRGVVYAGEGEPRPSGIRAGFWLGVGQLGGELAVSQFLGNQWTPAFPEAFLLLLVVIVPTAVLWWTAGCAGLCADLRPGWRRTAAGLVTLSVAGTAFAWWYGCWQAVGTAFAAGMPYSNATALEFLNQGFAPADRLAPSTTSHVIANLTIVVVSLASRWWGIWLTAALWIIPLAGLAHRRLRPVGRADAQGRSGPLPERRRPPRALLSGTACGVLGGVAAGVGVVAVTYRAHVWIWQDGQSFVPGITVYADWLFAVLLGGVIGAVLLTSLLSRGDVLAAMAAAGSAMAIGSLVLLAVNATDGCVRPLNTVRSTCAIATGGDRQVLSLFLPELLAMAGMAALVAGLPIAVIARIPGAMRPAPARPGAAPLEHGTRRLGAVRLTTTAAVCTVLLGLSAANYSTATSPASAGNANRAGADPLITDLRKSPLSDLQLGFQVYAWAHFGGADIMGDYEQDLADIDRSVASNGTIDGRAMRRGCTHLIKTIDRAYAYFPIPDAEQQTAWTAALANSRKGAQDCLDALTPLNTARAWRALSALNPPVDPVATLFHDLDKLTKPFEK
ncbi:M48 family metalloprotease [Streptomyces sp. NPDC002519]